MLGKTVRQYRLERGLRQIDLARRVGLSRASIISLEQGEIVPKFDQMVNIARILHMDMKLVLRMTPEVRKRA